MSKILNFCKKVNTKLKFASAKIFTRKPRNTEGNIALVFFGGLGDGVILLPYINSILRFYKDKKVVMICNKNVSELFKNYTDLNDIITTENHKDFLTEKIKLYKSLQKYYFEKMIDLNFSRVEIMNGFVAKHINTPVKICMQGDEVNMINPENVNALYTEILPIGTNVNEICNFNAYLNVLGIENLPDISYLKKYVKEVKGSEYVVFAVGASLKYRIWPIEKWIEVAKKLLEETSYNIVVCGSSAESEYFDIIKSNLKSDRIINACGGTTLGELVDLLGNSKFVLANDSGPAHIASSTGVNGLVLLGGGFDYRYFPHIDNLSNRTNVDVVFEKYDCWGCKWLCNQDDKFKCVKNIDVNSVLKVMREKGILPK